MTSFHPPKPDPLTPAERAAVSARLATVCPPRKHSDEVQYRYSYKKGAKKGSSNGRTTSIRLRALDYVALGFTHDEIAIVLGKSVEAIERALA